MFANLCSSLTRLPVCEFAAFLFDQVVRLRICVLLRPGRLLAKLNSSLTRSLVRVRFLLFGHVALVASAASAASASSAPSAPSAPASAPSAANAPSAARAARAARAAGTAPFLGSPA